MTELRHQLAHRRVVCTVGSGGVGKTTCAAALGLVASAMGRKALVLTIDPAKRLASAMGLSALSSEERVLDVEMLRAHGVDAKAPLAVRMLDLKASWDDMVRRLAPNPRQAEVILANRFYTYMSTELAGAQEYIACEALYTLSYERDYDLVILDTPPTAHALDFLDAPSRILSILDNDAVKWASKPALAAGRFSLRILDVAGGQAMKAIEKITGMETLKELSEFLVLFEQMFDPIRQRTAAVQTLLGGKETSFVLVASPERGPLNQALFFLERLREWHLGVGAVVVNRVRHAPHGELDAEMLRSALLTAGSPTDVAEKLVDGTERALVEARRRARQDLRAMAPLRKAAHGAAFIEIPRFGDEVHDIRGLWQLARHLVPFEE
ncbi:MAG: ArsA family ATPase [Myxococcota bacterium]